MERPTARSDGAGENEHETSAERLIAAMHATCSHDLPNQILSLQSLIHLMEMDEVVPAGAAGHEYLMRLKAVAEKTAAMTEFLKTLVRIARTMPQPRAIALPELFRELMAEARSAFQGPLEWDVRRLSGVVTADRELVYPSLFDVLRVLTSGGAKSIAAVSAFSTRRTEVEIAVRGPGLRISTTMLEQRYEFLLARERLHVADVGLRIGPARVDEMSMVLDFATERT